MSKINFLLENFDLICFLIQKEAPDLLKHLHVESLSLKLIQHLGDL